MMSDNEKLQELRQMVQFELELRKIILDKNDRSETVPPEVKSHAESIAMFCNEVLRWIDNIINEEKQHE